MKHGNFSNDLGKEDAADAPNPIHPKQVQSGAGDAEEFDGVKCLTSSTKDELSLLTQDNLNYGTVCIYKVPEKHRNQNQEAYTPRLISIGFMHHGASQLQAMEEYKLKYFSHFLHTFRVSLEQLAEFVYGQEKLFLDTLYNTFVLNNVRKCFDNDAIYPPSFHELAHKYFKSVGNTANLLLARDFRYARHLVQFLSILRRPDRDIRYPSVERKVENNLDFARCPTVTELKAAGVKFQQGNGKCLLDVHFDSKNGVLKIPALTVNDSTETCLRNLIAFEQSGYHFRYMSSYVILLDNLIDTHKDVDVLIQCGNHQE
ncbi:OLC1v1007956C1 [Oldenlandia corymbosa var. corymbosa]|uniref:OLC1v1007956C1 n=1 Tax=Oldenlandia corymbosa var. corymbosa TaxID=529605 RepID=A0AAV1DKW2_OLDCO|nr:OLC1v1007956C1 [Oldenlandia corymbosa var. corymbosa]